jgi:hypothetical protein
MRHVVLALLLISTAAIGADFDEPTIIDLQASEPRYAAITDDGIAVSLNGKMMFLPFGADEFSGITTNSDAAPFALADFNGDNVDDLLGGWACGDPHTNPVQAPLYIGPDMTDRTCLTVSPIIGGYTDFYTTAVLAEDFTKDGLVDAVVVRHGNLGGHPTISFFEGYYDSANSTALRSPVHTLAGDSAYSAAAVDIGQHKGLVIAHRAGANLWAGHSDGTFRYDSNAWGAGGIGRVIAADINGDGRRDAGVYYQYTSGVGTWLADAYGLDLTDTFDMFPVSATFSDVDRDGHQDLVTLSGVRVNIQHGNGTGIYTGNESTRIPMLPNNGVHVLATGDINGDGLEDIFVADRNGGEDAFGLIYLQSGSSPGRIKPGSTDDDSDSDDGQLVTKASCVTEFTTVRTGDNRFQVLMANNKPIRGVQMDMEITDSSGNNLSIQSCGSEADAFQCTSASGTNTAGLWASRFLWVSMGVEMPAGEKWPIVSIVVSPTPVGQVIIRPFGVLVPDVNGANCPAPIAHESRFKALR